MENPLGLAPIGGEPDPLPLLAIGDYLCSDRALFRVEQLGEDRAVIEDCLTLELIDVPLAELLLLRPVRAL